MAFTYGYTDGVINDISIDYDLQPIITLNGYRYEHVRIGEEVLRYLRGAGRGKKHRFYWLGKGKGFSLLAVRNEANEILAEKMTSERYALLFLFIPLALGFLTWFITWVPILGISWWLAGGKPDFDQVNIWAGVLGVAVAGWKFKQAIFVKNTVKNVESFPAGQLERYGKREFGIPATS